ncbi:MYND-type zinc finger-containing chromatin reader Zmynd8 [Cylas formicarius]|uniref:MYND-type zinc finger-containing chromatin reader Zmynd8 n=1 Tax=Cylas formicarius TaxID=197179 RepID=UPI0029586DED|nr:MYND-type zinc finger-containing chromatin reader Zmynd8 [Cylas formicarius]
MTDSAVTSLTEENHENKPENATKRKDDTSENMESENETETSPPSRELKLLLALSKEAKLETNLSRKRKSLEHRKELSTDLAKSKNLTELKYTKFPVTAESELEVEYHSGQEGKSEDKVVKKKKLSLAYTYIGGEIDDPKKKKLSPSHAHLGVDSDDSKKARKLIKFKANKDMFCWRCHKDGVNISCETCVRSYHQKCLKQTVDDADHWPCPECVSILKAESTSSRSAALKGMTLEHLCSLLKFAVTRMMQCQGSRPFIHPVNPSEFPDYKSYIIQPMDLTLLEKNIKENLYGSTQAFEADAKWILHNSIIFNSYQSKLTTVAKFIIKICKQEMAEIENCPTCYLNANTKKNTWFVEVCPKPHLLVWAKLRGFPYWPGKVMVCKDGMVDVRFFGAHDRAWVPERECFLYSQKDPNGFRQRRTDIEQCIEELNIHIENLKKVYGEFCFPPFKTPLSPDNEFQQLRIFLPQYRVKTYKNKNKIRKSATSVVESDEKSNNSDHEMKDEEAESEENPKSKDIKNDEDVMEGYGTDDETPPEINTEIRKELLTNSKNSDRIEVETEDTIIASKSELHESLPTKAALKSFPSDIKVGSRSSELNTEVDEKLDNSSRLSRRNSEAKSDSSRYSNISDKINTVDVLEQIEISLPCISGAINRSPQNSENSRIENNFTENKKKPVQIDIINAELSLSPPKGLKIVEKLIKRLSNEEDKIKRHLDAENANLTENQELVSSSREEVPTSSFKGNQVVDDNIDETVKAIKSDQTNSNEKNEGIHKETDIEEPVNGQNVKEKIVNQGEQTLPQETGNKNIVDLLQQAHSSKNILLNDQSFKSEQFKNVSESLMTNDKNAGSSQKTDEVQLEHKSGEKLSENALNETQSDICVGSTTNDGENITNKTESVRGLTSHLDESDDSEEEDNRKLSELQLDKENIMSVIHSSLSGSHSLVKITPSIKETINSPTDRQADPESRKRKTNNQADEPNKKLRIISNQKVSMNINIASNNEDSAHQSCQPNKECSVLLHALQSKDIIRKCPSTNDSSGAVAGNQLTSEAHFEEIKSEPDTDVEYVGAENFEEKKKYLSALNILERKTEIEEKSVRNEIRTRSKVEEKRARNRMADNLSRIIDSVATNERNGKCENESTLPPQKSVPLVNKDKPGKGENGEIFVKSFARMGTKARARKSFPGSYAVNVSKKIPITAASTSDNNPEVTSSLKEKNPKIATSPTVNSHVDFIQPNKSYLIVKQPATQDLILFPSNQTINNNSTPKSMENTLVSSVSSIQPQIAPNSITGENSVNVQKCTPSYISLHTLSTLSTMPFRTDVVQCTSNASQLQNTLITSGTALSTMALTGGTTTGPTVTAQTCTTTTTTTLRNTHVTAFETQESTVESFEDDEFRILNNLIPEGVNKVVSELIQRPPPKLKPRPPGMLSTIFSEGTPSSAGDTTAKINSVAHRLSDYFRGMLIETLNDLGKSNNPDATITGLKLEIESLKHKHSIELSEIEKNMCTILKDIQKSIVDDRERIIQETREACEAETVKRIEDAKSKQWCASCSKEAQFYCCWNTSYCDYPCQQKHWPTHMSKCTQNMNSNSAQVAQGGIRSIGQQLILRPTTAPSKVAISRTFSKPIQKVYLNRNISPSKTLRVQTPNGNFLTVVESSPGNYQLMGNSVVRSPQGIANLKCSNTSSLSSSSITFTQPKHNTAKMSKAVSHSVPVSTVVEDDSD